MVLHMVHDVLAVMGYVGRNPRPEDRRVGFGLHQGDTLLGACRHSALREGGIITLSLNTATPSTV